MAEHITAVTVTYNRAYTLGRCIDALLRQERPVDTIIIVDNHSRPDELEKVRGIASGDGRIHLLELGSNTGGAGGFEAGMRFAFKKFPADWYWIMDDDAYPRPDCLGKLLEAAEPAKGISGGREIGFLAPLIYGIDLGEYQFYHHKYIRGNTFENVPICESCNALSELNRVDANAFVGPLISKRAIEECGIADGSLFIYGDDTEYTYRVSRSFAGVMVRDAVIDHQDPPPADNCTVNPGGWWKDYYSHRNRILLAAEFSHGTMRRLVSYLGLAAFMLSLAAAALTKPKYSGYRRIRVYLLLKALIDGIAGRRGRRVDPDRYGRMLREHKRYRR